MNGEILDISELMTPDRVFKAAQRNEIPAGIGKSKTNGQRRLHATLAENCVGALFHSVFNYPGDVTLPGDRYADGDFIFQEDLFEVKTKMRTIDPQESHTCHIDADSTHQKWDYVVFVSMRAEKIGRDEDGVLMWGPPQAVHACGFLSREEFYEKATFLKKGEFWDRDPGFRQRTDCYALLISDLEPVTELFHPCL